MVLIRFKTLLAMAAIAVTGVNLVMAKGDSQQVPDSEEGCKAFVKSTLEAVQFPPEIRIFMQEVEKNLPEVSYDKYEDVEAEKAYQLRSLRPEKCNDYEQKLKEAAEKIYNIVPICARLKTNVDFFEPLRMEPGPRLFSAITACWVFRPQGDKDDEDTHDNDSHLSLDGHSLESCKKLSSSFFSIMPVPYQVLQFVDSFIRIGEAAENSIISVDGSTSEMVALIRLLRPKECGNHARKMIRSATSVFDVVDKFSYSPCRKLNDFGWVMADLLLADAMVCLFFGPSGRKELQRFLIRYTSFHKKWCGGATSACCGTVLAERWGRLQRIDKDTDDNEVMEDARGARDDDEGARPSKRRRLEYADDDEDTNMDESW